MIKRIESVEFPIIMETLRYLYIEKSNNREDVFVSKLAKYIYSGTPTHTFKIIKFLEDNKCITSRIDGRQRILKLTPMGEMIGERCQFIMSKLPSRRDIVFKENFVK
jgi:predicted transcriptional regulator